MDTIWEVSNTLHWVAVHIFSKIVCTLQCFNETGPFYCTVRVNVGLSKIIISTAVCLTESFVHTLDFKGLGETIIY